MTPAPDTPAARDTPPAGPQPAQVPAAAGPGLTWGQWRQLARLQRWLQSNGPDARAVLGPRAAPAETAMREARALGRQRLLNGEVPGKPLPVDVLSELAAAARQFEARVRARPAGWFAKASTAMTPQLLLQMPALKAWLRDSFALEVSGPDQSLPVPVAERAREALMRRCMALGAPEDTYLRRRHLLQLLNDHGYQLPLLVLARRSARGWAPAGWAGDWQQVAGLDADNEAVERLAGVLSDAASRLRSWNAAHKPPAAPASEPAPSPVPPAPTPRKPAARTRPSAAPRPSTPSWQAALQALRRWAAHPRYVLGTAGVAVVAVVGVGLTLHLSGPASAQWVTYFDEGGTTMSIDPDSIERNGRQLSYRVAVVRRREDSSSIAWFTTDCSTRQRRLETIQHYRGTRFDTALSREVRGKPVGTWPSGGADVRLLQAACAGS